MKFEDIELGKIYQVEYIDNNYPCNCPCHTTPGMLHCIPCCDDRSFSGNLRCIEKVQSLELGDFLLFQRLDNENHRYRLKPESIIREVNTC